MANWKLNLRQASFRGVTFAVDSHQGGGGRRVVQHEYAQRDTPFTEDNGRRARKYSVEAFILGSEYMSGRDALLKALEESGPGQLIHPYLGTLNVNCSEFSYRESARDGGMVVFSVTFVETGEELFPSAKVDALTATRSLADMVRAAKRSEFVRQFNVLGLPQFILNSAASTVRSISDALSAVMESSGGLQASAASAAAEIEILRSRAEELVQFPGQLFDQMEKSYSMIFDAVTDKRSALSGAGEFEGYGSDDPPISGNTATRDQERQNRQELNSTVRLMSVSEAALASVQIDFESQKDADEVRALVLRMIDDESDETLFPGRRISDDVFASLQDLRAQIVRSVPGDDQTLGTLSSISPKENTTSLTVAYDVYGSIEKEDDIIKRNAIRDPGLIPGGGALEVLLEAGG